MKPKIIKVPSKYHKDRRGGRIAIDTMVVHAMGEWVIDDKGTYHHCTDFLNLYKYSVHAFCLPDGRIIESVDPERKASHAGKFNNRSIGMEFVIEGGQNLESLYERMADKENPPYTKAQYAAGGYWFRQQADRFGLRFQDIKGHSDVDPARKKDPGSAFDWAAFKEVFDAAGDFSVIETGYDDSYGKVKNVFGEKPESILVSHLQQLDRRKRVLDIGIGQGRNAFYLAEEGFKVDGIDPSGESIRQVERRVEADNLPVNAYHVDFDSFKPSVDTYSGICLFGILQVLSWDAIHRLLEKIDTWTTSNSLVFITAFTTQCPTFTRYSQEWTETGKNSFTGPNGQISTYLEKGELLKLFHSYEAIYHWVGMGPLHRHGSGPLEKHGKVEAVFKAV